MNPGKETTVDILVKILMFEFRHFFWIGEINLPRGVIGIWVSSQWEEIPVLSKLSF